MVKRIPKYAPKEAHGYVQIIPSRGPHEQIFVGFKEITALVEFGHVAYDPDYGPNGRVYRPVGGADASEVRSWLDS